MMSSITFPCKCKIRYDLNDKVQKIEYCNLHKKLHNGRLDLDQNALNLEDQIFEEIVYRDLVDEH